MPALDPGSDQPAFVNVPSTRVATAPASPAGRTRPPDRPRLEALLPVDAHDRDPDAVLALEGVVAAHVDLLERERCALRSANTISRASSHRWHPGREYSRTRAATAAVLRSSPQVTGDRTGRRCGTARSTTSSCTGGSPRATGARSTSSTAGTPGRLRARLSDHRHSRRWPKTSSTTRSSPSGGRRRPSIRPAGAFRTFFLSLVHHRAVDAVRREERLRRAHGPRVEPRAGCWRRSCGGRRGRRLPRTSAARRSARPSGILPRTQRQVLEMAYFGGRTRRPQIAEELSIPVGTVKTRTLAAMRKLRRALYRED